MRGYLSALRWPPRLFSFLHFSGSSDSSATLPDGSIETHHKKFWQTVDGAS
jgi:hypothetical protein